MKILFFVFLTLSSSVALTLTPEMCASHSSRLGEIAGIIAKTVDTLLIPSKFERVSWGGSMNIVNETDGEKDGGETNTFGSYGSYFFNTTEIFPSDSICDIPTQSGGERCDSEFSNSFFLGPSDVIVFFGCTPPPMKYFAHDLVIGTRITNEYPFYPGQNFGDTISSLNINVSNTDGNVFNQPSVVIQSADFESARAVADAYINSNQGITENDISIRVIDGNTARLFYRDQTTDYKEIKPDFLTAVFRITAPAGGENDPEYLAYKSVVWPTHFYFASDNYVSKISPTTPPLKPRYSDKLPNEVSLYGTYLEEFAKSVVNQFEIKYNATFQNVQYLNLTEEGYYDDWDYVLSKQDNSSFVLPTRDCTYGTPISQDDFPKKRNTAVAIVGLQHTKIFNTAYSSVGVDVVLSATSKYQEDHWFLDDDLVGSAARYLSDEYKSFGDIFYVVDILPAKKCPADDAFCSEFEENYVNELTFLVLGERIYGVKETNVGPSANTTIASFMLVFELN